LEDRAPCRGQIAPRRHQHGGERQADTDDDALQGDPTGPAGNDYGLAEAIEAIDGEHHIGRFR